MTKEKAILKGEEVLEYIPQRAPMLMIDSLYACTEKSASTGFYIDPSNIFVEDGTFNSMGLIENIAQTAAIFAGFQLKKANIPVRLGFIGNIKKLSISLWPKVGETIYTTIEEVNEVMDVKIIKGEIKFLGQHCASCEMKIFLVKEEV